MANAQKQNNLAMIQAELNEALERYEKEKRFFRELLKVKLFHDKDALRFLIESTRKELREKELNEECQKQSELQQQNHGRNHRRNEFTIKTNNIPNGSRFAITAQLIRVTFRLLCNYPINCLPVNSAAY
jgi:hypothetical protein